MKVIDKLAQQWRSQLARDYPNYSTSTHESIINWLLGDNSDRFEALEPAQLVIAEQAMNFRYQILRARYLGVAPDRAYRHLIGRLGSGMLLRQKIRTWVSLSRDRQRTVVDVVAEVIQEMLQADRYMQQQIAWIAECTSDARLRNSLLLAAVEEYCMRPVRNQPLLVYRFVNYLRRTQRGGLTQVPTSELIRLVSDEITATDSEGPVNLLDTQAVAHYQDNREWEERQLLRSTVQHSFESYLAENLDQLAVEWLRLYLQGLSQDAIAKALNLPVKQVYRLREKITYHAIRVFAIKMQPELVAGWLEISLTEHGLGLTPGQWQQYCDSLTPVQRQLLDCLKAGESFESIAQILELKPDRVISEWSKLYLAAQNLRNAS